MTKYIVGRPLKVGEDQLDVGDVLTKKQIAAIPRLESWISMRHIYVVATQRDLDMLPRFLAHRISLTKKAVDRNEATNFGDTDRAIKGREDNQNDLVTQKAKADAEVQGRILEFVKESRRPLTDEELEARRTARGLKTLGVPETDAEAEADVDAQIEENIAPVADSEAVEATPEEIVERVESETFDPGEHSVAEVKDYIESHPDEKDAILAAEAAGKARKSLVE